MKKTAQIIEETPFSLDFCFRLTPATVCVVGWQPGADKPDLALENDGTQVPPAHLSRHVRPDTGTAAPQGVLAAFPLPADGGGPVTLRTGRHTRERRPRALEEDARRFVAEAVDPAFYGLLYAIAGGDIAAPGSALTRDIRQRVESIGRQVYEGTRAALCIDRVLFRPDSGRGVVEGWHLPEAGAAPQVRVLMVGHRGLVPGRAAARTIPREDLASYGGRYAVTGTDGYHATFEAGAEAEGSIALAMAPMQDQAVPVTAAAEPGDKTALAEYVLRFRGFLPPEEHRRFVAAATSARALGSADLPPRAAPPALGAGIRLLLDHDGRELDVREVLTGFLRQATGPVWLELLSPAAPPRLLRAVEGARREAGGDRLRPGTPPLNGAAERPAIVVHARSSALLQLGAVPAILADLQDDDVDAAVTLHSALLATRRRQPEPAALLDALTDGAAPFVAAFRAAAHDACMARIPDVFLTPDGRARAAVALLARAGRARLRLDPAETVYDGRASAYGRAVFGGDDQYGHDHALLQALLERG